MEAAMDLQRHLETIERHLWTNDPVVYTTSLVPEALLAFAETGIIGRDAAVAAIRAENAEGRRWAEVAFDDTRLLELGPGVVLLSYRARARWSDAATPVSVLCGSVYVERDGGWRLAYHQQSEIATEQTVTPVVVLSDRR
jgi:Domain of unknown function (DUF4440)